MAEIMIELPVKMIDGYGPGATDEIINFTEKNLRVSFPKEFILCIKQCDSGTPEHSIFEYTNPALGKKEKMEVSSFLSFNPCNEFNILRTYLTMPPFIPRTLLPFAEVGNGDLICFDYSIDGLEDKNPPVVYWIHDNPSGKEIADIAINFIEFLKKLHT